MSGFSFYLQLISYNPNTNGSPCVNTMWYVQNVITNGDWGILTRTGLRQMYMATFTLKEKKSTVTYKITYIWQSDCYYKTR